MRTVQPVAFFGPVLLPDGSAVERLFPTREEAIAAHLKFEKDVLSYQNPQSDIAEGVPGINDAH